ncbi:hypothetical protein NDU88_004984 [Pleurodeles waltl]|uniref:Uncharacterized protein n=1 Tax=Pleurodeles waltl TaxID=8319 RepID=A0AAV7NQW7_PLEWA|nr:hypothetical protein NDU88_004984 [Pleurodeles waltl]
MSVKAGVRFDSFLVSKKSVILACRRRDPGTETALRDQLDLELLVGGISSQCHCPHQVQNSSTLPLSLSLPPFCLKYVQCLRDVSQAHSCKSHSFLTAFPRAAAACCTVAPLATLRERLMPRRPLPDGTLHPSLAPSAPLSVRTGPHE